MAKDAGSFAMGPSLPTQVLDFLLNLVGLGIWIERISSRWGLFLSAHSVVPVCWVNRKKRTELTAGQWASVVLVLVSWLI